LLQIKVRKVFKKRDSESNYSFTEILEIFIYSQFFANPNAPKEIE
jgi:hypothetical protein